MAKPDSSGPQPFARPHQSIPLIDLQAQRRRLGRRLEDAIARVLAQGQFIMGPEVTALEGELAGFAGVRRAVSCASGTDALRLILMAWGIGPGDAVFVPGFTFAATAEAVCLVQATPVFVDVRADSFTLDPSSLEGAIAACDAHGLRPAAVIPVDLFGLPADYPAIQAVAERHGLRVLADAAQSFGAGLNGRRVGSLADATALSFFPSKPLGCYGDGGAIVTDDVATAELIASLRLHGRGSHKYDNVRVGLNSRLDSLQAAILIEKLAILAEEIAAREAVAARYAGALADLVAVPLVPAGASSAWAHYTIRVPNREHFLARLARAGIATAVYYPKPLHQQAAYSTYPRVPGGLPNCEALADDVVSLPMHPYLDEATQDLVIATVCDALTEGQVASIA